MNARVFATKIPLLPEARFHSMLPFQFHLLYEVDAEGGCLGPVGVDPDPERMYTPSAECGDKIEGDKVA